MKKLFLIAAMMIMTLAANAQLKAGNTYIKPTIGINLANISKWNGDMKFGINVGGEIEHNLSKQFSLSAGLLYSMQGTQVKANGQTIKNNFDYLNIPVLVNFYAAQGLALKFGVQPGFKTKANVSKSGEGHSESGDLDGAESMVFAIPVGISYQISDFVLDARYSFGISNVMKEGEGKHGVFSINLAYKLPL